jgi:hypothetical protein
MGIPILVQNGGAGDRGGKGSRQNRRERELSAAFPGGNGASEAEKKPAEIEVPRNEWLPFLDSFSRQHLHWMGTIEATTSEGRVALVEGRPFVGISADHAGESGCIYIQMGESVADEMTHIVQAPRRIVFQQTPAGEHRGLKIVSADGRITFLRFRSRVRPEMLDGI